LGKISGHIRTAIILVFMLHMFNLQTYSQYEKLITLLPTYNSGVNWVDIDGDGDLDLAISGADLGVGSGQGRLYLNEDGFDIANIMDIRPVAAGDQKWSDFNNDSIPDLLYAGNAATRIAGIDTFDVSLIYHDKFSGFTPVGLASVDWGDYDNDGDYDVLIAGQDESKVNITKLYRNDNGIFTDVNAGLPGIIYGKVGFIDYDLDMDLDIFICGQDANSNKYARLWRNSGGIYQVTSDIFANLQFSQFDWADFNNDGYPDLILCGLDNVAARGKLYLNNAGSSFTLSDFTVPGARYGSSAFGDVDNDGDLDVFISGYKAADSLKTKYIFLNKGTGTFISTPFVSDYVSRSFQQFGDYNNDNKLDFAANGADSYSNGVSYIATDTCSVVNVKPSAPQNLESLVEGRDVILKWDPSTDNTTPQKALTYNIYVGTTSKGIDVVSPVATISTGFRKISRQGYIQDTAWMLKNLPVGTYYWGVQAIDNSLGASPFSTEATFEIKDRFTKASYTETIPSTSPAAYFDCDHDNDIDIFLHYNTGSFWAVENTLAPLSQDNYRTILSPGYYYVYTLTPNDYNNDNLMDFSISGRYAATCKLDSTIALFGYKSPFSYEIIDSALVKNVNFEFVIWADFNNDGKQDFLTSGKTTNLGVNNKPVTYLYKNLGNGVFQKTGNSFRGFEKTGAVAGDFDNDMDIDIVIYGKDSLDISNTYLYINNGLLSFTENLIPNNELYRYYLKYGIYTGDFDLNGKLDLFLAGFDPVNDKYAKVLLNNDLSFSDANLPLKITGSMSNFWADYDYDGDLDIYITTSYNAPDKVRLYLNNNGTLEELTTELNTGEQQQLDLPFMAVNLDNKNGLDFIMKINGGAYNQYYDNWGSSHRINTAPVNTRYDQDKLDIIFKWDKIANCPACTYNIRVGISPGGVDIMSPMSDLTTGYRYVVQPGNAYLNDSWKLCDLPVGKYYWSVQAVDPANTGGPWAPEDSFTVSLIDADFSFTTICRGDSTEFTDLSVSTEAITGWKWNFGDGKSSALQNPKHLYANAGTFTAGLWAYSESGDSAYQDYEVLVKAVPDADFTADIACLGTSTNFTNNTNPNGTTILSWLWNFGDGEVSTQEDPGTNGYINAGNYEVNLVVTADNGCVDSATNIVSVGAYPVTLITADAPLTFCKGDSVTLSVPYDSNYDYNWMAGGTSITGGDTSKYVARLSGNYNVEVINPVGDCRDTSSIVTVTSIDAPVAPLITADGDTEFCQGDSVILSVTNTAGYTYLWKLSGGEVGTTYKHAAKSSGKYSLTVTNSTGCKTAAVDTVSVTVNAKPSLPTINISGTTTFCEGSSVELSVINNPALTYQWENNGIAITGATAYNYNVQNSGVYSLKITNAGGCHIRSEDITVNVLTAPSAPLISTSRNPEFCEGDSVVLSVTNIAGCSYEWKLNGGAVGSDSSQFIAKNKGEYNLVVTNTNLCSVSSSNSVNVVVNTLPTAGTVNLSGSSTFCEGGSVTLSISSTTGYSYNWRNEYGPIPDATTTSYTASSQGIYQLDITNSYGCVARTLPVNVTVKPMPYVPVITSDNYQAGECMGETPIRLYVDQEVPGYNYQWYRNGIPVAGETLPNYEDFLTEGDYSLEADLDGCTAESNIMNVYFEDAPDKPFIHIQGPTVWYLVCSDTTGSNYRWYCNGNLIERANKYYYIAGRKMGDYQVSIGNSLGCYTMSDAVTIPTGDTGTDDVDPFEGLKIYPNPTTGLFTIAIDNNIFGELIIRVIAENGKEVMSFNLDKTTEHFLYEVDLSGQSQGLYIINLLIDKYFATRKVIVE